MMNDFYENFFSFAAMLGSAPQGGVLTIRDDSIAAASGQPYAGENYAIFGAGARPCDVKSTINFFHERNANFVVPILPVTPCNVTRELESHGIVQRHTYTAMSLPPEPHNMRVKDRRKDTIKETTIRHISYINARQWGTSVWFAFGGPMCSEAESYAEYAAFLARHKKNDAFALENDAHFLSTALIHKTKKTAGLYYFATLPKWRRHGFAARLMDTVTAKYAGTPFVLLATEEGLPFYLVYGFNVLAKVPIYSASDDI